MVFLAPLMFGFPYPLFTPSVKGGPYEDDILKHNTIVFTTFVYLQLFNFFNCRKLGATEFNIFQNFFNNWIFLGMVVGLFAAQYLIVTFGTNLFQVSKLTIPEHLICMAFAVGSLLVCFGIKHTPEEHAKKIPFTLQETKADKDAIALEWDKIQAEQAKEAAKWESL